MTMKQPPTLTEELRQYLRAAVTRQRCKAERLARLRLVNRRTLSRRLQAEGTSFKQLNNEAQFRVAMGALEQANFDLTRTTVVAPSDGGVTNLSLAVGQVLGKGEAAMTYIDLREVWIEAAFRENSLEIIAVGNPVEIVLDLYPGRVIPGRVASIGYGVGNRSVDARTGLPSPRSQSGWIRTPESMPVRIEFDKETHPPQLRVGSQASVMVYPSDSPVMNAIGRFRMRLVALLTYVH
jgi:multidrug resistance efflux pump